MFNPSACGKTLQSHSPGLGKCLQRLCFPLGGCQECRRGTTVFCHIQVGARLTNRGLRRCWKQSSSEEAPRGGTSVRPLGRNPRHSALGPSLVEAVTYVGIQIGTSLGRELPCVAFSLCPTALWGMSKQSTAARPSRKNHHSPSTARATGPGVPARGPPRRLARQPLSKK